MLKKYQEFTVSELNKESFIEDFIYENRSYYFCFLYDYQDNLHLDGA